MKKFLHFLCLLALCSPTAFAQTQQGPRKIYMPEKSAVHVPPPAAPLGLRSIYSNLGSKTDLYRDNVGWGIWGFNSNGGSTNAYSIALPFTPKFDSHVGQVRVAVKYVGPGANQVNLSIYADSNGTPGTLLAGPVTVANLPDFATCCALTIASFTPLAVSGGTRYWVVADTPATGTGSDFTGAWSLVSKIILYGTNDGVDGWFGVNSDELPAGEVMGTVP